MSRYPIAPLCALALLVSAIPVHASPPKNLAPTPPMGWNSWNWYGRDNINETIVRETIDAMVKEGLRDAGYTYIVVDGGWRDSKLGPNGELRAHPEKFPHGIKFLADYAHERGFKFGVHTVPGTHDCGGNPVGGFGHEDVQFKQFVDWGLDFVKLDKCKHESGWDETLLKATYAKWSALFAASKRDMVFSISAYVYRDWYPDMGQMARTTGDIRSHIRKGGAVFDDVTSGGRKPPGTLSVMRIADINNQSAKFAGHGYWNDPDMMVVGDLALSVDEQKAHFALWCVMSSPLMLGNDPRQMTAADKEIILNREAIAVNQDPTEQGQRVRKDGPVEVWVKHLTGNRVAVLLLNRDAKETHPITVKPAELGLGGAFKLRDLNAHQDLGRSEGLTKPTAPHASWFLIAEGA